MLRRTLMALAATVALGCLPITTNAFAAGYIAGHDTGDDVTGSYGGYASNPGYGYGSPGTGYAGYGTGYSSAAYGSPGYAYGYGNGYPGHRYGYGSAGVVGGVTGGLLGGY